MTPPAARSTATHWTLGAIISAVVTFGVGHLIGLRLDGDIGTIAATLILSLAMAPLFVHGLAAGGRLLARATVTALMLIVSYAIGHAVFTMLAPETHGAPLMDLVRLAIVALAFGALYVVQAAITTQPAGPLARSLYPACFAGFYLDELWTRYTFRLWPPRPLPSSPRSHAAVSTPMLREVTA